MKEFNYEGYVLECYKGKKNTDIHNASTENALLLFKTLLDEALKAKKDVRIISGSLLASFYNELVEKIQQVLNSGTKVDVIVEKDLADINDIENNKFYQKFKHNIISAQPKFKGLPNFIVVGNSAYRFEKNKEAHKAVANFNNPSMGEFLVDMFDNLKRDIKKAS